MYFSGQNGQLQIGGPTGGYSNVGRLKNWSYSIQQQTLDTTCLDDTDKTIIPGVRSGTGSASLLYYEEATSNVERLGQKLIKTGGNSYDAPAFGANTKPELCRIRLYLDGGSTSSKSAVGMYAYITSFDMSCAVGEVVTANVSWEIHGSVFEWDY